MTLIPNTHTILTLALEEGIRFTRRRADKHAEDPITDAQWARYESAFLDEAMNAIYTYFDNVDPEPQKSLDSPPGLA